LGTRTGPPKLAPKVRFGCSGNGMPAALLKKLLAAQLVWRMVPNRLPCHSLVPDFRYVLNMPPPVRAISAS
jgi:hypothetical protein